MNISRIQLPLYAVAFIFAAHSSAFGAAYTWDFDSDATIGTPAASTAGSGTWNAANTNWNLAGSAGSDVAWVANSEAVFAGSDGTYAITVGSALTVSNLTFSNSGYTLSAASAVKLSQFNVASVVTVATGKTATIGSNVTYENTAGANLSITGTATAGGSAGTLIIDNGGKVNTTHASGIIYVGSTANTVGTLRSTTVQVNTGGTLSSASSVVANGLLKVNGGTVSSGGTGIIAIGNYVDGSNMPTSAILTIDSGTVTTAGGVRFGTTSGSTNSGGTLNLNGGTLSTPKVYSGGTVSSSTVNFNGGTLKATVLNNSDFLNTNINNAIVKAGGAVINTNTFDVTISKALTHDSGLGGTADGGLTKLSTGKLTLSGTNTYTGATTISDGTLTLASSGSISSSASIKVGASGTFDVSAVSGYTLASGQALRGSGSVTGAVVAGSGSTIAGGVDANTVGTLTFNSTLNISGLASGVGGLLFDLAGTVASDKIVSGALTIGTGVLNLNDFSFTTLSGYGVGTYTLLDATSIVGTLGSSLTGTIGGLDAALSISGNDLVLTVSAIPEPSTYAAFAGLGVLALATFRRRRA